MSDFVYRVYSFIYSIFDSILNTINQDGYITFLDKQIIGGTLLNVGLTWRELFLYLSTWFFIVFFIYFIVKIVYGVIRLVCLR